MRCEVAKFGGVWQADRRNFKVRRIYTRKKCKANTFCLNKLWSNAEAMGKGKSSRAERPGAWSHRRHAWLWSASL